MARRTQAQLAETRHAIIQSAKGLFAEHGFAHTQVAQIAAAAGIGISAFYGQFRDKEELLLLIVSEMFDALHDGVLEVRRSGDQRSPLNIIITTQRIYDLVFETLNEHKEITLSAFRSGFSATPALEELYWTICNAVATEMGNDISEAEKNGLLQVNSGRDMADAMVGMILQLSHRMVREGSPSPTEAATVCTQFTLGALLLCMPKNTMDSVLPLLTAGSHVTTT